MGLGGCDRADFSVVVSLPSIRAATENTFPAPLLLPIGTAPLARAIHCYNSCTCVQNMLEQWQLWAVIAKRYFLYLPEIFFSFLFCPFVKTADLFLPARLHPPVILRSECQVLCNAHAGSHASHNTQGWWGWVKEVSEELRCAWHCCCPEQGWHRYSGGFHSFIPCIF